MPETPALGRRLLAEFLAVVSAVGSSIRAVQADRRAERGFREELSGTVVRRLFVRKGRPCSTHLLFDASLSAACIAAGLIDAAGRPTITAHRFRHTVGTQLAESGARLHTIMQVLGHTSPTCR